MSDGGELQLFLWRALSLSFSLSLWQRYNTQTAVMSQHGQHPEGKMVEIVSTTSNKDDGVTQGQECARPIAGSSGEAFLTDSR